MIPSNYTQAESWDGSKWVDVVSFDLIEYTWLYDDKYAPIQIARDAVIVAVMKGGPWRNVKRTHQRCESCGRVGTICVSLPQKCPNCNGVGAYPLAGTSATTASNETLTPAVNPRGSRTFTTSEPLTAEKFAAMQRTIDSEATKKLLEDAAADDLWLAEVVQIAQSANRDGIIVGANAHGGQINLTASTRPDHKAVFLRSPTEILPHNSSAGCVFEAARELVAKVDRWRELLRQAGAMI